MFGEEVLVLVRSELIQKLQFFGLKYYQAEKVRFRHLFLGGKCSGLVVVSSKLI
jgi:hypothetical protein